MQVNYIFMHFLYGEDWIWNLPVYPNFSWDMHTSSFIGSSWTGRRIWCWDVSPSLSTAFGGHSWNGKGVNAGLRERSREGGGLVVSASWNDESMTSPLLPPTPADGMLNCSCCDESVSWYSNQKFLHTTQFMLPYWIQIMQYERFANHVCWQVEEAGSFPSARFISVAQTKKVLLCMASNLSWSSCGNIVSGYSTPVSSPQLL